MRPRDVEPAPVRRRLRGSRRGRVGARRGGGVGIVGTQIAWRDRPGWARRRTLSHMRASTPPARGANVSDQIHRIEILRLTGRRPAPPSCGAKARRTARSGSASDRADGRAGLRSRRVRGHGRRAAGGGPPARPAHGRVTLGSRRRRPAQRVSLRRADPAARRSPPRRACRRGPVAPRKRGLSSRSSSSSTCRT